MRNRRLCNGFGVHAKGEGHDKSIIGGRMYLVAQVRIDVIKFDLGEMTTPAYHLVSLAIEYFPDSDAWGCFDTSPIGRRDKVEKQTAGVLLGRKAQGHRIRARKDSGILRIRSSILRG